MCLNAIFENPDPERVALNDDRHEPAREAAAGNHSATRCPLLHLQSLGQLDLVSAHGQPSDMQTISSHVPLPQRFLHSPPEEKPSGPGFDGSTAVLEGSPGQGANSQFGAVRPTADPSGHTFASSVQATPLGAGAGTLELEEQAVAAMAAAERSVKSSVEGMGGA